MFVLQKKRLGPIKNGVRYRCDRSKVKMGAQLSVFESAYKQLDRELNDPAVDTMQSLQSFLDSCQSFDVWPVRGF